LLFVTSIAAGATVVPPYKGSVSVNYNSVYTGGCGAVGKTVVKAAWSPITGVGHFADSGAAKACPMSLAGVGGSSNGEGNGEFEIAVPLHVGTTGAHSVGAMWSFKWATSEALTVKGSCPAAKVNSAGYGYQYCSVYADAYIYGYSYLVDTTNGSYFYSPSYWSGVSNYTETYNDTYCYNFNCTSYNSSFGAPGSSAGSTTFTWWFNGTMVKSHHYALVAYVYGAAYVSIYGYPAAGYKGSFGSAMLNMGTLGNGAKLTGISVT